MHFNDTPECDRNATYSPEEMDIEYYPWDCDNVSSSDHWEDDDDDDDEEEF